MLDIVIEGLTAAIGPNMAVSLFRQVLPGPYELMFRQVLPGPYELYKLARTNWPLPGVPKHESGTFVPVKA